MTTDHANASSREISRNEPFALVPAGRGGPQEIPFPAGAKMSGPAPWAHIPSQDRSVTLSDIITALSRHRTPRLVGNLSDGIGHSAVLCLLYERAGDVYMILTRRSPRLRHHAHEVAFPGGRREAGDGDLWKTAVREAQEEVGIDPSTIRRIGELDSFVTVGSRTLVTPFVAVTDQRPTLQPDPIEVELIRHVSFRELLLDEVWREEIWSLPAVVRAARRWSERPSERSEQEWGIVCSEPRGITFFELVGDTVWGATGAMLRQLLAIATGVEDPASAKNPAKVGVVVG